MTLFARVNPDTGTVDTRDFAAPPPSSKGWLPLVFDAQPTPGASQRVVESGFVVEPTQVRKTWALVAKTAAELSAETDAAELAQLQTIAAALQAGTGTAAERLVRVERVCLWLLRQAAKRGAA